MCHYQTGISDNSDRQDNYYSFFYFYPGVKKVPLPFEFFVPLSGARITGTFEANIQQGSNTHVFAQRLLWFSQGVAVSVMCFTGCCIAEKSNIDLIRVKEPQWVRVPEEQSIWQIRWETPLKAHSCQKCDLTWKNRYTVGDNVPFGLFAPVRVFWSHSNM